MPAWSVPVTDPVTGKVIGIACGRGRRYPPCSVCKSPEAKLACDGCDCQLCAPCAVSPKRGLDFCPVCTKPAFDWWKQNEGGQEIYAREGRPVGRVKFRAWVKVNQDRFITMVGKRSEESLREGKTK